MSPLATYLAEESGNFRADVIACRSSGDRGTSHGLFQSSASKARACASVESAAHLALEQLRASFAMCAANDPEAWAAGYTSGRCDAGRANARRKWRRTAELFKSMPFEGGAS